MAFELAKMYGAASTPDSAIASLGRSASMGQQGAVVVAQRRRKRLLEQALASGAIKPQQVGPADLSILGIGKTPDVMKRDSGGGGLFGKVGGFLGNLGSDIFTATKYAGPGLFQLGKGAVQDVIAKPQSLISGLGAPITAGLLRGGEGETYKRTVKPTIAGYREYYGHDLPQHFYEHPLQLLLDAATVISGGSSAAARGGGALVRATEPGSTLSRVGQAGVNLTSREGRPPLMHPVEGAEGEHFPGMPREYTPRPISKLAQRALDTMGRVGGEGNIIGKMQRGSDMRRQIRMDEAMSQAGMWDETSQALDEVKAMANLDDSEAFALTLSQQGINTPQKLDAFQEMVRQNSLQDPKKLREIHNQYDIPESYVEQAGHLPPDVVQKVLQPTPAMVVAHEAWKRDVAKGQEELGYTPEMTESHIRRQQAQIQEHMVGDEVPAPPDYPIEPTYVPMEPAAGFQLHRPGVLAKVIPDSLHERFGVTSEERYRRGPTDRPTNIRGITAENLLVPKGSSFEHESTGATFATGAFRRDARLYLDHVSSRTRTQVDKAFKQEQITKSAARNEDGSLMYVSGGSKGQADADAIFGKGKTKVLPPDYPIAWFHNEIDHLKRVNDAIDSWLKEHPNADEANLFKDSDLEAFLNKITDEDAKAFVATHWGAMKRKQIVLPIEDFEYRLRLAKVNEPFNTQTAQFLTRMMHRWRTAVLTLMPRWGVNTAIGSFVLNGLRGVNLQDYVIAERLQKAGMLPPGVSLGHQAIQEVMDAAAPGFGQRNMALYMNDLGIRVPTRAMLQGVQNIENFFRRAQFVHNLKREQRLERDASGRIVEVDDGTDEALGGIAQTLREHYSTIPGKVREALDNPRVMQRALDETNKMAYNYSILGPFERRVVRQFVPFWGWYKFITMAAYRMPLEFPGRANLLNWVGSIAQEDEAKLGPMPEWVKGSIPVNLLGGKLKYMSTMGANPFSQIANPLKPGASVQGMLQLGQLNPLIQAGLSAYGFDTLTGDRVRISPQEGVGQDFLGRLYKGDRQISPAGAGGVRRFFMGLLRSLPEYRIGEQAAVGTQYPEGVPFVPGLQRPMGSERIGLLAGAASTTGLYPKNYDLTTYQQLLRKSLQYSQKRNLSERRRLSRKLRNPR